MRKISVILLGAVMLAMSGCGYDEGIIQRAEASFLLFRGNMVGAVANLDGETSLVLEEPEKKKYQLSPGKHRLKVTRGGKLLIDRILFLDNQTTTEIDIP